MTLDYGAPQPPAPGDELHSTERLAQALLVGVNPLVVDHELLHRRGLTELAERVKVGEFDATKAESDAWANSPEGRATFEELVKGR